MSRTTASVAWALCGGLTGLLLTGVAQARVAAASLEVRVDGGMIRDSCALWQGNIAR